MSIKRTIKPLTGMAFSVLSRYKPKHLPDPYIWKSGLFVWDTDLYDKIIRQLNALGEYDGAGYQTYIGG